jgi:DNA polymerase-4
MTRRIIHVDMDAFYASVEQRDDPWLRGRPVIVGGSPEGRGVVCAASYEARAFGVRSAMPTARAVWMCPDAVFVPPDFAKYQAVSHQLRDILHDYTDQVEPISLDEAYLDVTQPRRDLGSATAIARELRARIAAELHLTASAGVGPSKLVAKIASDMNKPDGLTVVPPARVKAFLYPLPIERLWGVGPATAERLHHLGLRRIGDIAQRPPEELAERLGSLGVWLVRMAQGDDPREVHAQRERRSCGSEHTFAADVLDLGALVAALQAQSARVSRSLERGELLGRTVSVKVRYADFETVSRAETLPSATADAEQIGAVAARLLGRTEAGRRPVRLVGVSMSSLEARDEVPAQLRLPFAA